jgi:signal transduction histidine kinase
MAGPAELERKRNIYLATVAHEIRNALAPLATVIEVLALREPDADGLSELLPVARRQVRQLAGLTEDLLDVGRAVNDEFHMTFATVSIQEVVSGVVASWQLLAHAKRQSIKLVMPADALFVRGDRVRLSQVLQNIVGNAVKYTAEHGNVAVSVTATAMAVSVTVTDTGIGIPEEDLVNIFQLFYRVRHHDEVPTSSFGIGLALTRRILDVHGGTVRADSRGAGCGTTFTVSLPLAVHAEAA